MVLKTQESLSIQGAAWVRSNPEYDGGVMHPSTGVFREKPTMAEKTATDYKALNFVFGM